MSYQVHLSPKSSNVKTGPIPVSTTTHATCPDSCGFKGQGCYAQSGPLALHWRAVTEGRRGTDWQTFCANIAALPEGTLWRHNQAGDLPGNGALIDAAALSALVRANRGRRGFTYTHYKPRGANARLIDRANRDGFVVNLSADDLQMADAYADANIAPVVVVVARDAAPGLRTPAGRRVVLCPATQRDDIDCAKCQLCARGNRSSIIGFPAHGSGARRAEERARRVVPIVAAA